MAICPRCETDLVVREATPPGASESLDVDCCGTCGGMFIDGAELTRASPHLGGLFGKRREMVFTTVPSGIDCPRCRGPLSEVGVNDVPVDWCATCFGVWLDGGEYQALHQRKAASSEVACYVCKQKVALADTFYTDQALVCSSCHEGERGEMAKREVLHQAAEKARRDHVAQVRNDAARDAARATAEQLRNHLTGAELRSLRDALHGGRFFSD